MLNTLPEAKQEVRLSHPHKTWFGSASSRNPAKTRPKCAKGIGPEHARISDSADLQSSTLVAQHRQVETVVSCWINAILR